MRKILSPLDGFASPFGPRSGAKSPHILLSNSTVDEDASIGDLVGTLSVLNGSGSYTFSITADPDSKFAIDGVDNTRLELGAAPDRYYVSSSYSVTIEADNGVDAVLSRTFTINVTPAIAPSFTSDAAQSVADDAAFSLVLETDEPCTFAIIGGADADQFDLTTDDLTTAALDYDNPQDSDLNNTYIVDVRATSVATGLTADETFTITVQASDTTPDAFTFTDVTNATLSTVYESNTITVAGITSAAAISVTGGEYSKNGGAYTSSSGTVVNGDTVKVRHTSSASYTTATNTVLTIGGVSDTYTTTTLAFSPSALFAASEKGGWYDPSDFSTMWQDTAGTTAVTATGQSVARIDDKSGNGYHLTQGTAANRPTLQQDAQGKYYLDFDGTNDQFSVSADFSAIDAITMVAGVYKDSSPGTANILVELSTNSTTTTNTFCFFAPGGSSDQYLFGSRGNAAARVSAATTDVTYAASIKHVVSGVADISADSNVLRVNKTQVASNTSDQGTGSYSNTTLFVGGRSGPSNSCNARLYGLILRGVETTGTTLTDAEDWMNGKIGAY